MTLWKPRALVFSVVLYAVSLGLLFGGAELISVLADLPDEGFGELADTNPLFLSGLVVLILSAEALLLTVAPIEIARRLLRRPWVGALIGILIYAVGMHWSKGWQSVLLAGWIAIVIGAAYLVQSRTSRPLAILQALGLKWAFAAFVLVSILR